MFFLRCIDLVAFLASVGHQRCHWTADQSVSCDHAGSWPSQCFHRWWLSSHDFLIGIVRVRQRFLLRAHSSGCIGGRLERFIIYEDSWSSGLQGRLLQLGIPVSSETAALRKVQRRPANYPPVNTTGARCSHVLRQGTFIEQGCVFN